MNARSVSMPSEIRRLATERPATPASSSCRAGGRITPGRQHAIGITTQQIASDVARLEDAQQQNPALLRGSFDSLRDSMPKIDTLLEQPVGYFAEAGRLSRGPARGRH